MVVDNKQWLQMWEVSMIKKILIRVIKRQKEYVWRRAKYLGISANAYLVQLIWKDMAENENSVEE